MCHVVSLWDTGRYIVPSGDMKKMCRNGVRWRYIHGAVELALGVRDWLFPRSTRNVDVQLRSFYHESLTRMTHGKKFGRL
jgi:hypothetical protein